MNSDWHLTVIYGIMPDRSIRDPKNNHFRHQMLQTESEMEMTHRVIGPRQSERDGGASSCLNTVSIEDAGNLLRTLWSIRDGGQRASQRDRNQMTVSLLLSNRASVSILLQCKMNAPARQQMPHRGFVDHISLSICSFLHNNILVFDAN